MFAKSPPTDRVAKARSVFQRQFEQPFALLPEDEQSRRAAELRSEYYRQLAYRRWRRAEAGPDSLSDRPE